MINYIILTLKGLIMDISDIILGAITIGSFYYMYKAWNGADD